VTYALAVVAGLLFGAADQYLGSRLSLGPWAWAVSGMSAPWLIVPFVAGVTQRRARRAAVLGSIATFAALLGYFAMTYSPMESIPASRFLDGLLIMVRTNVTWEFGGAVAGPLFGYLGWRWRVSRWWVSAAAVATALCFEPLARAAVGMLTPVPVVWLAEVGAGVLAAMLFGVAIVRRGRGRIDPAV
jgi:hypothetical protein